MELPAPCGLMWHQLPAHLQSPGWTEAAVKGALQLLPPQG